MINRATCYVVQAADGAVVAVSVVAADAAKAVLDRDAWYPARKPHKAYLAALTWDPDPAHPEKGEQS